MLAYTLRLAFMKIGSGFYQPSWVREILACFYDLLQGRSRKQGGQRYLGVEAASEDLQPPLEGSP